MAKTNFVKLTSKRTLDSKSSELDYILLSKYKKLTTDNAYFDFIVENNNCEYFYDQALNIYGYSKIRNFMNIDMINNIIKEEYGDIFQGLVAFGQDVFGSQFCFNVSDGKIILFDSESGDRKVIASDFTNWIDELSADPEYYTGINVLNEWSSLNKKILFRERLCPKKPFIMGGEFAAENLYASTFPDYIKAYANIAKQVYNLPNGTKAKIIIGKKE